MTDEELQKDQLAEALKAIEHALAILDKMNAPGDIGAHLDLAVNRLADVLGERR